LAAGHSASTQGVDALVSLPAVIELAAAAGRPAARPEEVLPDVGCVGAHVIGGPAD